MHIYNYVTLKQRYLQLRLQQILKTSLSNYFPITYILKIICIYHICMAAYAYIQTKPSNSLY